MVSVPSTQTRLWAFFFFSWWRVKTVWLLIRIFLRWLANRDNPDKGPSKQPTLFDPTPGHLHLAWCCPCCCMDSTQSDHNIAGYHFTCTRSSSFHIYHNSCSNYLISLSFMTSLPSIHFTLQWTVMLHISWKTHQQCSDNNKSYCICYIQDSAFVIFTNGLDINMIFT